MTKEDVCSPEHVIEEFEKRLVGSPNSSLLWIKYISTLLRLVDIDKARAVAERALQVISFREEQEKMNVWVAYLNMENLYGTPETLKKVFDRSIVYCDACTMHMQLAKIYAGSGKKVEAERTYQILVKKFSQSCKVWLAYAEYLYGYDLGNARKLLNTALKSLPKRKHEKATMKFAQLEYRLASHERGRTLFEGLLSNAPKRIDLWSIYVTMEENRCKSKDHPTHKETIEYTQRLYERIVHMKLSSKKAKYFFKRYLQFEKTHGNDSTITHVKELVKNYVDNSINK